MVLGKNHPQRDVGIPSIPFSQCPAKTYSERDGSTRLGRTVVDHCQIVGEVARALIAHYPSSLRKALFPPGAELIAACHDIGKVSPYFFEKIRRACTSPPTNLKALLVDPSLERNWGGHAGVSQVAAKEVGAPKWVPEILGQHHGFSPPVAGKRADAEVFGGEPWQAQRCALIGELRRRLHAEWPEPASVAQARLLAGLTSVADWIGSGKYFEDPSAPWQGRIVTALEEAGFVPPRFRPSLSFQDIFGFAPREAQTQLVEAATSPGAYILEAPMGLGKTEAALFAAYQLLQRGEACGIYFALPTQLTSNKILTRFNLFLNRVLASDCPQRALLLHANAWLVETEMGEEGRPGGAWFHHRKRGLLAPFAVGTIDQALMAAMHVKHGFVRTFGLAGKVVILDEVHTYDMYTGTLLDALVRLLRELHCTVIILSATLNHTRRSHLLNMPLHADAYPLITAATNSGPARELPVAPGAAAQVSVHVEHDDRTAVQEALDRAAGGQQVLWIENTVKDAQQRYLDVASRATELGATCGLLHSRFTRADRQHIEDHWVSLYGKPGAAQRKGTGRILVGTQVLEQSLDIDADFLITRFAPTDMLLQRMGRLWRHAETARPEGARREIWMIAPTPNVAIDSPQVGFGASAFVYSPYILCRSLEVWMACKSVSLPQDIRRLIESTYAERVEQGAMARWLHELNNGTPRRKGRVAMEQLARVSLAMDGKTLPESKASTRYSETDNFDVLLLCGIQQDKSREASRLRLLDGTEIELPWKKHKLSTPEWKKLTARLMLDMVPVRAGDAPFAIPRDTLEKYGLQHCFYLGDRNWPEDESLLRLAVVDDASTLRALHGGTAHNKYTLIYRDDLGYQIIKS